MADDPLRDLLGKAPLSNPQRAELWDLYQSATNQDDLAEKLQTYGIPKSVKADLWDLKAKQGSAAPATPATAEPARTWGDTAKDVAIGVAKGAAHTAIDAGKLIRSVPAYAPGVGVVNLGQITDAVGNAIGGVTGQAIYGTKAEPVEGGQALDQARTATDYTNAAQQMGGAAETLAEMAVPVTKGVQAIPTAAKAGAKFQEVMGAARNVPVGVNAPGAIALRINELAEHGGSLPMAVRKFLNYVTDPKRPDLTYEVSRDFASNLSRLSSQEYQKMTPVVAAEVAKMSAALNRANAAAAQAAGKGAEYVQAMREYAKAKQIEGVVNAFIAGARKAAPYIAGGAAMGSAAGYSLADKLKSLLPD